MEVADIVIRESVESDLAAVTEIVRDTLLEHIMASGGDASMVTEEFLRSTLEESSMVVAVVEDEVVGYLQFQVRPPSLVANGAAVRRDYQRRGVGTALFGRCIEQGVSRGCERVEISVQPTNKSVHDLYRRLGFVEGENPSGWNQELMMPMSNVLELLGARSESSRG